MVLALSNISKSFGAVKALSDVSLELVPGEVHALVGENGAGKSTLIKIITGGHAPDAGSLSIDGKIVHEFNPVLSRHLGVAVVYQQPTLFPDLTVAENLAFGVESVGGWRWIRWSDQRRRANELLQRIRANISPDSLGRELSMPEQQLVEIARAVGQNARVLIMDEPTASLNSVEVDHLLALTRGLADSGVAILYVSHRLEELPRVADRVTVLRDGCLVTTEAMKACDTDKIIRWMVGREVTSIYPHRQAVRGAPRLVCEQLTCNAAGIHDVSFAVHEGEVLGIGGLMGAGRTELARTLFGLTPADRGTIQIDGVPTRIDSPRTAIEHGLAYVPEDRKQHGVIGEMAITSNVSLSLLDAAPVSRSALAQVAPATDVTSDGQQPGVSALRLTENDTNEIRQCATTLTGINRRFERQLAQSLVERLRIRTSSISAATSTLSGGNQQKVALARWLATHPKVLILDEPTQGVDVGAKSEIYALIAELAASGMAIILISSEMNELLGMCDRIAVMRGGTIRGTLDRSQATAERLLEFALELNAKEGLSGTGV